LYGYDFAVFDFFRFREPGDHPIRVIAFAPTTSPALTEVHGGTHPGRGHRDRVAVPPLVTSRTHAEARAVDEAEASRMAPRLAREAAEFAGSSSALNVVGAIQFAIELGAGHTVDSGLKYLAGICSPNERT
jgi:cysteine synthase A